jgi:hypothetical protein
MTTPRRIQWSRFDRMPFPAGARLVDRSGRYGNPFTVKKYGRDRALDLHRGWLRCTPDVVALALADGWRWPDMHGRTLVDLIRANLAGHDLVCTGCGPDDQCHADLILYVASGGNP